MMLIQDIKDLKKFLGDSDVVVAYRNSVELKDVKYKVYTRDIFEEN